MSEAVVAQKAPYKVDVEEGKNYFWCSCGKSAKQPFCDGAHQDTSFHRCATPPRKPARCIFVAAKRVTNRPYAMVRTINYSRQIIVGK